MTETARPGEPDIYISFGAAELPGTARQDGPYRWHGGDFEFAMPDVARYVCFGGSRIVIDAAPGADPADIAAMLVATALPALLWSRGEIVLHASAFAFAGASLAVAVAGPSGSGKSTLLARAIALGASAIGDDSICLRVTPDGCVASGLPGGYFVGLPREDDGLRDFHPVAAGRQRRVQRLGAVLILAPGLDAPRRLGGVAALAALLMHRHRPRIARLMTLDPGLLPAIGTIAGMIPVVQAPCRLDFPA